MDAGGRHRKVSPTFMTITNGLMQGMGIKQIWPPKLFGKKWVKDGQWEKGQKLLVAIINTPYGDHCKEIYSQSVLNEVRQNPYVSARWYALSKLQVESIRSGSEVAGAEGLERQKAEVNNGI